MESKNKKSPVLILENSFKFKKGQILSEYTDNIDGIIVEKDFIPNNKYIVLNERLSIEEERKVKELIRSQLKYLFWQLYTKQGIMLGNL